MTEDNKPHEATKEPINIQRILTASNVRDSFEKMLGKKAQGFITSVLQIVDGNKDLQLCDPLSVYNAAATAATMDLPINSNLGFAWIVPYAGKAQFQMGYKGFIQLALRTGQYKNINYVKVYQNQFIKWDELSEELDADFTIEGEGEIVGYAAGFKLVNGFIKRVYWSTAKVIKHGMKYSKSYTNPKGMWQKDFEAMAIKTVIKNLLSKWGILSIEMQTALIADQSVIKDYEKIDVSYPDNTDDDAEGSPDEKAKKAAQATEDAIRKQAEDAKRNKAK